MFGKTFQVDSPSRGIFPKGFALYFNDEDDVFMGSTVSITNNSLPCSHDRANIEQTSSKCIQNIRDIWATSARCLLDRVNGVLGS